MTRQEMYDIIVEKGWADEIKKKYKRPYISCSNDTLVAFIAEKQGGKSDADKKATPKKDEKPAKMKKSQEEVLADVLTRVDKYKASTEELRKNTERLEDYTKLLENIKKSDAFLVATSKDYSTVSNEKDEKKWIIRDSSIRVKFEDTEFVRELLICFITERINKLMDSIEKNQKEMKEV